MRFLKEYRRKRQKAHKFPKRENKMKIRTTGKKRCHTEGRKEKHKKKFRRNCGTTETDQEAS
jgi:hypothetical protein